MKAFTVSKLPAPHAVHVEDTVPTLKDICDSGLVAFQVIALFRSHLLALRFDIPSGPDMSYWFGKSSVRISDHEVVLVQ